MWTPSTAVSRRRLSGSPWLAVGLIALLTVVGGWLAQRPVFDYNLLNLQPKGTESVVWENRLHDGSGRSSWFALSVADSISDLRRKQARFEALHSVDRVESVASLVPEDQEERLALVHQLAPYIEEASGDWTSTEPIDLDAIERLLGKIRFKLQRDTEAWAPTKRPSQSVLASARQALLSLQDRLQRTPPQVAQAALERFQTYLMSDFADKWAFLERNVQPTLVTLADVPGHLRQRFVSPNGQYLMQIFARENIWEREAMETFVSQLEQVEPDITGPPVIALHSIQQMQQGYARGGLYALIVIVGMMWLVLGRLRSTLLALVPVALGGLWTLIGMGLLGLNLNMANVIIVPLFIGIAVDDGIHLMHRLREDPASAQSPLAHSTGKAILLTSLTTMIGFGSLMVARHSGIFSLGLLSTLAVGASLIATVVGLPLLINLLSHSRSETRSRPNLGNARHVTAPDVARPVYDPDYA